MLRCERRGKQSSQCISPLAVGNERKVEGAGVLDGIDRGGVSSGGMGKLCQCCFLSVNWCFTLLRGLCTRWDGQKGSAGAGSCIIPIGKR